MVISGAISKSLIMDSTLREIKSKLNNVKNLNKRHLMDKKIEKGPNLSLSAIIGSFQKLTGAFLSTLDGSKEDLFLCHAQFFRIIFREIMRF